MALKAIKTEHNGPKHGRCWLTKQEAKVGSRKRRRVNWKKELQFTSVERVIPGYFEIGLLWCVQFP